MSMAAINETLEHWLVKKGGAADLLKSLGRYTVEHPWKSMGNVGKGLLAAGPLAAGAETGVRTIGNVAQGNLSLGSPTWTGHQMGHVLNTLGVGSWFTPTVTKATQGIVNGLDQSPGLQQFLQTGANITDPAVRNQLLQDASKAMTDSAGAVIENAGKSVGGLVGKSLGNAVAMGMWNNLTRNPLPTILGATVIGAGPAIAYDMATQKRRQEEAERNKAILRYLVQHEKHEKTAGMLNALSGLAESPAIRNLIHKPTGVASSVLHDLAQKAEGASAKFPQEVPTVNLKDVQKSIKYPQTLLNNSITRNPMKSYLGSTALAGTGMTLAQARSDDPQYNDMNSTSSIYKHWFKNVAKAPYDFVKSMELGGVESPDMAEIGKSPTMVKVKTISNNIAGNSSTNIPPPLYPSYRPPSPDEYKSPYEDHPILKYLPYAGAAGLIGLPLATYMAYKRSGEAKLNKDENINATLQKKLERANEKHNVAL